MNFLKRIGPGVRYIFTGKAPLEIIKPYEKFFYWVERMPPRKDDDYLFRVQWLSNHFYILYGELKPFLSKNFLTDLSSGSSLQKNH